MTRPRISEPLDVGVRAINGLLTLGKGQRIGIMAGSGVGKSTLMGMIARYTSADVNVIGLIGERGREVMDFIEKDLGPEGLAKSVLVVATSDQGPLVRMRAAFAATAMAEFFRDQGRDVLLMMDSVTRFAMAAREVGLAAGEPPTTRGYTPTVFSHLPRLLERAGRSATGSITGIYTVLVEGMTSMNPWPMPSVPSWTVTSCSPGNLPTKATTRPSTCSGASAVWPRTWPPNLSWPPRAPWSATWARSTGSRT